MRTSRKIFLVSLLLFSINLFALSSDGEDVLDRAGYYLYSGEAEKAKVMINSACNDGYETACSILLSFDYTLTKEEKAFKMLPFLEKGCEKNESQACYGLAMSYIQTNGKIQQENIPHGIELLKKSCKLELAGACEALGAYYYKTEYNSVLYHKYNAQAIKLYNKGCGNKIRESCCKGARMYQYGKHGFDANIYKAKKLYEAECDLKDDRGCSSLGYMYEYGKGVRQDKSKAKEYYGMACDLGGKFSCNDYKNLNEAGF